MVKIRLEVAEETVRSESVENVPTLFQLIWLRLYEILYRGIPLSLQICSSLSQPSFIFAIETLNSSSAFF